MSLHKVILLLGSNLGDKDKHIKIALRKLEQTCGTILNYSKITTTEPIGFVSNNNFRNIAIEMEVKLSPIGLLKEIKQIEQNMGRKEDSSVSGNYNDRVIDIDIVIFDSLIYTSKKLKIPHQKNMYERIFSKKLIEELGYTIKHNI